MFGAPILLLLLDSVTPDRAFAVTGRQAASWDVDGREAARFEVTGRPACEFEVEG